MAEKPSYEELEQRFKKLSGKGIPPTRIETPASEENLSQNSNRMVKCTVSKQTWNFMTEETLPSPSRWKPIRIKIIGYDA